ncbi:MAG: heme oxygenase [Peltula sp. TS41687]|nr:MAG: heme oxygenase [Peltula sp. TS41687]
MAVRSSPVSASSSSPTSKPISLAEEVNTATRQVHSKLNHLVINRLPLALPPHTTSPRLYLSGLASFAEIYRRFESLWWTIIRPSTSHDHADHSSSIASSKDSEDPSHGGPAGSSIPTCEPRIHHILTHLYLPDLLRTESLNADLSHSAPASSSGDAHTDPSSWQSSRPQVQAFLSHMEASVTHKPHVLIAYAWVLYMALFSGGRWIRAQMLGAGADFWATAAAAEEPETNPHSAVSLGTNGAGAGAENRRQTNDNDGLCLFSFHGSAEDGEDLKRDFKSRLATHESALTPEERRDVVLEARQIFAFCVRLVEELDSLHPTSEDDDVSSSRDQHCDGRVGWKGQSQVASWLGVSRVAPLFILHAGRAASAAFVLLVAVFLWLTC